MIFLKNRKRTYMNAEHIVYKVYRASTINVIDIYSLRILKDLKEKKIQWKKKAIE